MSATQNKLQHLHRQFSEELDTPTYSSTERAAVTVVSTPPFRLLTTHLTFNRQLIWAC